MWTVKTNFAYFPPTTNQYYKVCHLQNIRSVLHITGIYNTGKKKGSKYTKITLVEKNLTKVMKLLKIIGKVK